MFAHRAFLLFTAVFSWVGPCRCLTTSSCDRHACFFQSYERVRGPHFTALFDELLVEARIEQKRALVGILGDDDGLASQRMNEDLGIKDCAVVNLRDYDPIAFNALEEKLNPTIYWIGQEVENSFALRYALRTSGMDEVIARRCRDVNPPVFVCEGAGVVCAGARVLEVGKIRGDDPREAPEPQFRGLELLGEDQSLLVGRKGQNLPVSSSEDFSLEVVTPEQVLVWSQSKGSAQCFRVNMERRGMIESLKYPPPVTPDDQDAGGVSCMGEPSVDPSRMMQRVGDSEWMD